jgi:MYXO-CTERM domain-containing protein
MLMRAQIGVSVLALALAAGAASASTVSYSTGFEPTAFTPGNINGQAGWSQTNPAFVGNVDTAAARTGVHGFRRSNAFASGSFGDQTFSPGLGVGVGEPTAVGYTAGYNRFETSFWFRAASSTAGDGSVLGIAPTDAGGSRAMAINLFNSSADSGVRVRAFSAINAGPLGAPTTFPFYVDQVLARDAWHQIAIAIDFVPGPTNDVVTVSINGSVVGSGTTWEDYYRFSSEQSGAPNLNQLFAIDRMIFRSAGGSVPGAQGFDFDDLTYSAVPAPGAAALLGLGGLLAARRRRD